MVKTDATRDKLIIRIGPRPKLLGLMTASMVGLILWGVGFQPALHGLKASIGTNHSIGGYFAGIVLFGILILFMAFSILEMLFGSQTVILDRTDFAIETWFMNLRRSRRTFPNSTIEKLRFEKWSSRARGVGMMHAIQFDCVGETVAFAADASEAESYDILDAMRKIYPFSVPEQSTEETASPAVTHW